MANAQARATLAVAAVKQVIVRLSTGNINLVDVPLPGIPERGSLVRVVASLLSAGTERAKIDVGAKSLLGKARARPDQVSKVIEAVRRDGVRSTFNLVRQRLDNPDPLGYSLAGQVVAVGPRGGSLHPGDRVACAGGQHAFHAEFVAVPRNLIARVPHAVSDEQAAYATVGAIAIHGLSQADAKLGSVIVVIGLGLVGQLAVQAARAAGCLVVGTDLDPRKTDLARSLGTAAVATEAEAVVAQVEELSAGLGADAVLVCAATPSSEPVSFAARLARDRGTVVIVGDVGMHLSRAPFYDKELDLRLSRSYGPGRYDPTYEELGIDYPRGYVPWTEQRNLETFLALCAKGVLAPEALTTHRFELSDAEDAYKVLDQAELAVGVLLQYPNVDAPEPVTVASGQSRTPAAGELEIAFCGSGNFANQVLIPAFARNDVRLGAVCSEKGMSAADAVRRFHMRPAVTGLEGLLATAPDALVIASRHDSHARHVVEAAAAGVHIFCEKPLCLTEDELRDIVKAVNAAGVYCFVGFNRRYSPLTQAVVNLLGTSAPRHVVIRVNAGALDDHWLSDPDIGGGRWLGEGCHFVDLALALVGAAATHVTATATGGGPQEAGAMTAVFEFADGSTASILYTDLGDVRAGKEYVEVHAGGRSAHIDDFRRASLFGPGGRKRVGGRRQDKGHDAEVTAFLSGLREARTGFSPGSLEATIATMAALDAAAVGARVRIPAVETV